MCYVGFEAIAPSDTTALEALLPDRWLAAHPEHRLEQREEESRESQARRRRKRAARRLAVAHAVHGDCPNFRGRDDVSPEIRLCRRENGTVPLGRKGTGTFFGLRASNVAQRLNRPKNEPVPGGL